jgi:subtilisin family serine protease
MQSKFMTIESFNPEQMNDSDIAKIVDKKSSWKFNHKVSYSSFNARIYSIYVRIVNIYENLFKRIDNFNTKLRDRIKKASWYKRAVSKLPLYKQRRDYFKSKINKVYEVKRRIDTITDVTDSESQPELVKTEGSNYNKDGWYWKKTVETYKTIITTTTTTWEEHAIYYTDDSVKSEKKNQTIATTNKDKYSTKDIHTKLEKTIIEAPIKNTDWETLEYQLNYGLSSIGAKIAYEQGYTGKGVTIAVLDTGIDTDNANFSNVLDGQRYLTTYNFKTRKLNRDFTTNVEDGHGHGTHVAGIALGAKNDSGVHGVAFNSSLLPVKVCTDSGSCNPNDVIQGLSYSADNNAKVVNISIGGYDFSNYTKSKRYTLPMLEKVQKNGSFVAVAAGNNGFTCKDKHFMKRYEYLGVICSWPAALPSHSDLKQYFEKDLGWVSVGAVDENNKMPSWSNKAGIMKDYYLVAPGVNIKSDYKDGSTKTMSGTSMASPHVAGAAALLFEKYPYLKGKSIQKIVLWTADDLGDKGVDDIFGHGKLNVDRAFTEGDDLKVVGGKQAKQYKANATIVVGGSFGDALNNIQGLSGVALVGDSVDDSGDRIYYEADFNTTVVGVAPVFTFDKYEQANVGNWVVGFAKDDSNHIDSTMAGYNFGDVSLKLTMEDGLLGSESSDVWNSVNSYYTNIGYTKDKFSGSLTYGYGKSELSNNTLISQMSGVHAIGAEAKWTETLSSKTSLWFGLDVPLKIMSGDFTVESPKFTDDGYVVSSTSQSLKPSGIEVNYMTGVNMETRSGWKVDAYAGLTTDSGHVKTDDVDSFVKFDITLRF